LVVAVAPDESLERILAGGLSSTLRSGFVRSSKIGGTGNQVEGLVRHEVGLAICDDARVHRD
jgi:hypothetical protein